MKFYEPVGPVGPVGISNLEAITQFHLPLRWKGLPVSKKLHLGVSYSETIPDGSNNWRGDFKVYGLVFDDSERSPFKKATLWLEGKCAASDKDVFAILVLDLNDDPNHGKEITFSPVRFGIDCKPKLPLSGKELSLFLQVAKVILLSGELYWYDRSLAHAMQLSPDCRLHEYHASWFLERMNELAIVSSLGNSYKTMMIPQEFERIFGVKLP